MLTVLPFYENDAWLTKKNLSHWISMDGSVDYPAMLVYDKETKKETIADVRDLARQYFPSVMEYNCGLPPSRQWPRASNYVFHQTVWHLINLIQSGKIPPDHWLWVESDAVAMRPGWMKAIDDRHLRAGKHFTGHWNNDTKVWNGVSVYPPAHKINNLTHGMMLCDKNPWDVVASKMDNIFKHLEVANDLFQHNWADPGTDEPWSFSNIDEVNALLRPNVVLFHRCKDGTLIDVLQDVGGFNPPEPKKPEGKTLVEVFADEEKKPEPVKISRNGSFNELVVIPFCRKDSRQQLLNLKLALKLDGKDQPFDALLSYDEDAPLAEVREMDKLARTVFRQVDHYCYNPPRSTTWPKPQNHAWAKVTGYIHRHYHHGWFWWESDAVPLKPGWLKTLATEYRNSGKKFMGYIVETMGHMNGVGFYPHDVPAIIKNYNMLNKAFDVAIRSRTINITHNANHLFQNMWSFTKEGFHTLGKGKAPSFPTIEKVKSNIDQTKVLFHRCKDGTLQQRLLEMYK